MSEKRKKSEPKKIEPEKRVKPDTEFQWSRKTQQVLEERVAKSEEKYERINFISEADEKTFKSVTEKKNAFVDTRAPLRQFFEDAYRLLGLSDIKFRLVFHVLTWYVGDDVWPLGFNPKDFDLSFAELARFIRDLAVEFGWVLLIDRKRERIFATFTRAYMDNDDPFPDPDVYTLEDHSRDPNAKMSEEDDYLTKFHEYDGPTYICGGSLEKRVVLSVLAMQATSTQMCCLGTSNEKKPKYAPDLLVIPTTTYAKLCEVVRKEITSKYKIWACFYDSYKHIEFLFSYDYYLFKWIRDVETRHPTDPFGFIDNE